MCVLVRAISFLALITLAIMIGCPPVLHLTIFVFELFSCLHTKSVFKFCSYLVSGCVGDISYKCKNNLSPLNVGEVTLSFRILDRLGGVSVEGSGSPSS